MLQLDNKCHNMESNIQKFYRKFNVLNQRGLPRLLGNGDKLISLDDYHQKLYTIARDKSKFVDIKGSITRKAFMEALDFDLFIKHEIKHLFIIKPTFQKYIEVDETYRKLVKFVIQSEDQWDKL